MTPAGNSTWMRTRGTRHRWAPPAARAGIGCGRLGPVHAILQRVRSRSGCRTSECVRPIIFRLAERFGALHLETIDPSAFDRLEAVVDCGATVDLQRHRDFARCVAAHGDGDIGRAKNRRGADKRIRRPRIEDRERASRSPQGTPPGHGRRSLRVGAGLADDVWDLGWAASVSGLYNENR